MTEQEANKENSENNFSVVNLIAKLFLFRCINTSLSFIYKNIPHRRDIEKLFKYHSID